MFSWKVNNCRNESERRFEMKIGNAQKIDRRQKAIKIFSSFSAVFANSETKFTQRRLFSFCFLCFISEKTRTASNNDYESLFFCKHMVAALFSGDNIVTDFYSPFVFNAVYQVQPYRTKSCYVFSNFK